MDNEKDNVLYTNKKISTTHTFKDTMKRVWEVIVDVTKSVEFFPDLISDINFIVGTNTYELGNEYSLFYKNETTLNFKCSELIDTEHYKKIVWKTSADEYKLKYDYIFSLYNNTIEKNVILVWDVIYDNPELFPMTKQEMKDNEDNRNDTFRRWQFYLKRCVNDLEQTESIFINASRKKVWDTITNWANFKKAVPNVADEVVYDGDPLAVGTNLHLIWITKEVECDLKVTKVKMELTEDDNEWEYIMECHNGKPKIPFQEMIFNFIEITKECTFLVFKHDYKQPIKQEMVDSVGQDKKHVLSSLKKYFEKKHKSKSKSSKK